MKINNPKEFKEQLSNLLDDYVRSKGFDILHGEWTGDTEGRNEDQGIEFFTEEEKKDARDYIAHNLNDIVTGIQQYEKDLYFKNTLGAGCFYSKYVKTRVQEVQWTFTDHVKEKSWFANAPDLAKFYIRFMLLVKLFQFKEPFYVRLVDGKVRFSCTDKEVLKYFLDGCYYNIVTVLKKTDTNFNSSKGYEEFQKNFLKNFRFYNDSFDGTVYGIDIIEMFNISLNIYMNNRDKKDENGHNVFVLGAKKYWDDNPE